MSEKERTTGVTALDAAAPFTGFLAGRLGAELLPLLDRLDPSVAPLGAYAHTAAVPLAWLLFLIPLATVLVRYTVRYYRGPAEEKSEPENINWYVLEDFLPESEATEENTTATAPASVSFKKTFCRLTQPFWFIAALASFAFLVTEICVQLSAVMTRGASIRPLYVFAAIAAQVVASFAYLRGGDIYQKELSRIRSALAGNLRQVDPPRGSYLLAEETEEAGASRVPPDWHGRPREHARADGAGTR